MLLKVKRRLVSVDEYHLMAEVGILTEQDRVELIRGEILHMSPIGTRHATCVKRINALFNRLLAGKAIVSVQDPVRLDDFSEPEPDIALLQPPLEQYSEKHPGPEQILLIIEVADSSLEYDREIKLPLYAAAGVSECWLLDLDRNVVEVHREIEAGSYSFHEVVDAQGSLSIPGIQISFPAKEVLG